jgi:predicted metal-dependent phosphotriesterase family hydrolase
MNHILTSVLPRLRSAGLGQKEIDQMMVANPRRLLQRAAPR